MKIHTTGEKILTKSFIKTRYLNLAIHACLFFTLLISTRDASASQPPKNFMDAVVYAGSTPEHSERYGAISFFIKCLKGRGAVISWEQPATKVWILHSSNKDALTKITTKISWEFIYDKKTPEIVVLNRVMIGKQVVSDSLAVIDNFKGCWEQPAWDTKNNLLNSVKKAKTILDANGMIGIKESVVSCYENANKYINKSNLKLMNLEKCLGIDATGYILEEDVKEKFKVSSTDPFYDNEMFVERASPLLEYYSKENLSDILKNVIGFIKQNY